MITPLERFIWGFERITWAFKAWVRLITGKAGKTPFYEYLQPFSWDRE